MKRRDAAILAAVVAVAGLAAVDALFLEPDAEPTQERTGAAVATADRDAVAAPDLDLSGFDTGTLRGSLVFTSGNDCRLREIALAPGEEGSLPRLAGDCELWAPVRGRHVAHALGVVQSGRRPFRLVDLDDPTRNLGSFSALFDRIVWAPEGYRVGWCGERGGEHGLELEIGEQEQPKILQYCPDAYMPEGHPAYILGDRLVAGERTILRASGAITFARWGTDGSVALIVDDRRLERWSGGRRTDARKLPRDVGLDVSRPIFSPDSCAALFPATDGSGTAVVAHECFPWANKNVVLPGTVGAWSPEGDWIATSDGVRVLFTQVTGPNRVTELRVDALDLAWLD